jgi:glycosyltransferase involved in cell wall biosynthesis
VVQYKLMRAGGVEGFGPATSEAMARGKPVIARNRGDTIETVGGGGGDTQRFAFVFSVPVAYPPNIHDMKCFYMSRELIARGEQVTWVVLGGRNPSRLADGIRFESIPTTPRGTLSTGISLARLLFFCLSNRIRVVYLDDWLFFRSHPIRLLSGVIGMKMLRIRVILDERDPSVDFRVATGELAPGTRKYVRTVKATRLSERLSNLIVLTSKAYEQLYVSEGFPQTKVLGSFRGIDGALFNPQVEYESIRGRLGLEGKFVIGWFGLMHPFRLIGEVLVPLIRSVPNDMPDAHVLIGGEGPLLKEFEKLSQDKSLPLTFLGLVPYSELPSYIAACDVLLCPVSTRFRHTRNSTWLKIPEALAVGRPVVASRTNVSNLDYAELKGVVWVEPTLAGFKEGIGEVKREYPAYLSQARTQAGHFDDFVVTHTVGKMVDRLQLVARGGRA